MEKLRLEEALKTINDKLIERKTAVDLPVKRNYHARMASEYTILVNNSFDNNWHVLKESDLKRFIARYDRVIVFIDLQVEGPIYIKEKIRISVPKELIGYDIEYVMGKPYFWFEVKQDIENGKVIKYIELDLRTFTKEEVNRILSEDEKEKDNIDEFRSRKIKEIEKSKESEAILSQLQYYKNYLIKEGKKFGYMTLKEFKESNKCIDEMTYDNLEFEAYKIYRNIQQEKKDRAAIKQQQYENELQKQSDFLKLEYGERKKRWTNIRNTFHSEFSELEICNNLSGTYIILCVPTFEIYIGSSLNIHKRIKHHFFLLKKGIHHSFKFQHAYNNFGEDSFQVFKLYLSPDDTGNKLKRYIKDQEQSLFDEYKPELNIKFDVDWKP